MRREEVRREEERREEVRREEVRREGEEGGRKRKEERRGKRGSNLRMAYSN